MKVRAAALAVPFHHAPAKREPMAKFVVPRPANGLPCFDVGVVVSFPYFLTPNVLAPFSRGVVNFHPSLLPR